MGSVSYAIVAAIATIYYGMEAWKYWGTVQYLSYLGGTTNWFEAGNVTINYTLVFVFMIAFVTQMLAAFGIAPMINYQVWFWGVLVVGGIAHFVGMFFYFLGFDDAHLALEAA